MHWDMRIVAQMRCIADSHLQAPVAFTELTPGDVLLFDGRIVHRGGARSKDAGARHVVYSVHHKWWYMLLGDNTQNRWHILIDCLQSLLCFFRCLSLCTSSLVLVVMKSKELKTKISHAHSLPLSVHLIAGCPSFTLSHFQTLLAVFGKPLTFAPMAQAQLYAVCGAGTQTMTWCRRPPDLCL